MDYACPERRKGKCDRKAKGRFMKYRKGGQFRSSNVQLTGRKEER